MIYVYYQFPVAKFLIEQYFQKHVILKTMIKHRHILMESADAELKYNTIFRLYLR